jgi:hypothetical protein
MSKKIEFDLSFFSLRTRKRQRDECTGEKNAIARPPNAAMLLVNRILCLFISMQ